MCGSYNLYVGPFMRMQVLRCCDSLSVNIYNHANQAAQSQKGNNQDPSVGSPPALGVFDLRESQESSVFFYSLPMILIAGVPFDAALHSFDCFQLGSAWLTSALAHVAARLLVAFKQFHFLPACRRSNGCRCCSTCDSHRGCYKLVSCH